MKTTRLLGVTAIMSMLVLPLVGCSGSLKISSRRLCESAGGTYSGIYCNPGSSSKKASEMCEANGGLYLEGEDTCRLPVGNL